LHLTPTRGGGRGMGEAKPAPPPKKTAKSSDPTEKTTKKPNLLAQTPSGWVKTPGRKVAPRAPADVRFGSKPDIVACLDHVRFTPESRHKSWRRLRSVLQPRQLRHVGRDPPHVWNRDYVM